MSFSLVVFIPKIATKKIEEFENRKECALKIMNDGLRSFRDLRSNKSDICYICLNQFVNGEKVNIIFFIFHMKSKIYLNIY